MPGVAQCRVCVLGAGVVGLTTATMLLDAQPHLKVTIIADKFLTETTSDGAAGLYRPGVNFRGPTPEVTIKWLKASYSFYKSLLVRQGSPEAASKLGLIERRSVHVATKDEDLVKNRFLEEISPDYRSLSLPEMEAMFDTTRYNFGVTYSTFVVECRKYLPYLARRFEVQGGSFVSRKIESFEQLAGDFDLVFNCSGLGAKALCGDTKVTPIRGQVIKVRAPWVRQAIYMDSDTYIIPGTDGIVTLGGTRQYDSTAQEVDRHDSAGIWERCIATLPSLKDAKIEREWVGLRPYRTEVRVEKQILNLKNGKSLKIIHNYGHGGYGVLSAPGTSIDAVSLGIQAMTKDLKAKL